VTDQPGSQPLVSVIVPSFNHARYVRACLESVVKDPYPAKELLVIDDGSTDGSPDIIGDWVTQNASTSTAVTFRHRANRGQTATLNELVGVASGKYVAYLASDDLLVPGGLEARVAYLEASPDKGAVFGDCEVIDADGNLLMTSGLRDLHGVRKRRLQTSISAEIVGNWGVPGPVLMYRPEAMRAIGGYDERHLIEDWYVYLGFVARGWLGFIDVVVARYRLHGANAMLQPDQQVRINRNLLDAAGTRLRELRATDRYRLVQQMASIRARIAKASQHRLAWAWWRGLAGLMKIPLVVSERLTFPSRDG
jgi:glycosyltransferase involved in cell wall biosynthesis